MKLKWRAGVLPVSMSVTMLLLAGAVPASAQQTTRVKAAERCNLAGGWYNTAIGSCEFEAGASQTKTAAARKTAQECYGNGGWYNPATGTCEIEAGVSVGTPGMGSPGSGSRERTNPTNR